MVCLQASVLHSTFVVGGIHLQAHCIRGHVIHVEAIYRQESIGMSDRPTNFACLSSFVVRCCSGVQRAAHSGSESKCSCRASSPAVHLWASLFFGVFLLRCSQIHCHSRVICNLADVDITSPANVAR